MADQHPLDSTSSPARPSLLRRVGRKGLQMVRPLALPLLHRLQTRIQIAIDQSQLTAKLDAVEREQAAMLGATRDTFARMQVGIDAIRMDLHDLASRIDRDAESGRAVIAQSQTAIAQNQAAVGQVLTRVDMLLQRTSLPLGNEVLLQTPSGPLLVPAEDRTLLAALWESGGRLEPGTVTVLSALLREGDQAIDVGAHIGLTVIPAARKVGPAGRIIAFEPGSRAASLLRQNLALNFISERVVVHLCAAGAEAGKARLHLSPILGESSLLDLPASQDTEDVDVQAVDSLVDASRPVRLIKIDAEGYEPQVWRGMQRIVRDNPGLVVLVEFGTSHLRRAGVSIDEWLAGFTAEGFVPYEIDEQTGSIRLLRPVAALSAVVSLNLLMLRQPVQQYPELQFE